MRRQSICLVVPVVLWAYLCHATIAKEWFHSSIPMADSTRGASLTGSSRRTLALTVSLQGASSGVLLWIYALALTAASVKSILWMGFLLMDFTSGRPPICWRYPTPSTERVYEGSWLASCSYTARASKSILNITNQRVPFILAHDAEPDAANNWEVIENQALKLWIVVYLCYPPTIIAKSLLSSSDALVVTICIISSIVGWIFRGPTITIPGDAKSRMKVIITMLEIVFILIGWAVTDWRSLASVRDHERCKNTGWFNESLVEDFYTGHIQEELKEEETKNQSTEYIWTKRVEARENQRKLREGESLLDHIIPMTVSRRTLLRCVLLLQFIAVFFSKVSFFIIELIFYNRVFRKIASVLLKDENENVRKDIESYRSILENVEIEVQQDRDD